MDALGTYRAMTPADCIVGYTYIAVTWCGSCLSRHLTGDPDHPQSIEILLDEMAAVRGVDRYDEHSYDSDDFPKVILIGQICQESCGDSSCDHDEADCGHDSCDSCGVHLCE